MVKYGVPQESILGPLLFRCYIKGISKNKFQQMCLYADDISLKISGNSLKTENIVNFYA